MATRKKGVLEQSYKPCQHLLDYRAKHGTRGFRALRKYIRSGPLGKVSLRKEEKEIRRCGACGRSYGPLYACLLCATIGCSVPPGALHTRVHAQTKPGHDLAVDIDRAELFCCTCNDQVYDPDFDSAVICARSLAFLSRKANGIDGGKHNGGMSNSTDRKKLLLNGPVLKLEDLEEQKRFEQRKRMRKAEYRPWVPTSREQQLLRQGSTPLSDDSCFPLGLRGLNNLGNTCFMNSVLQALLHTPPLRNYFLSDRHNRTSCQKQEAHLCLGCDMDTIYSASYSGDRAPYSPAQFLYSWWQHAANLAGYEQQDAHEFFISTIDGIHANSGISNGSAGDGGCHCIVHRVFSGLLRSDVTCTVCGFTSTTYDPCVDISLDLEPSFISDKVYPDTCLNNGDGGRTAKGLSATNMGWGFSTLFGCLDRFTRPERLGSNEKLHCQSCQVRQESIKQMSVRKLPLVLCFHIKRFEHSSTRNTSRKVDRYVQFPFSLDMAPYLSSSIVRLRHGNRLLFLESDECDSQSPEFELFAVVTHSGKLDSGHYISYLRLSGQWYKCDDAWVTKVSEEIVRASQGYMLYYVQKTFSYKASEPQSVKLLRSPLQP